MGIWVLWNHTQALPPLAALCWCWIFVFFFHFFFLRNWRFVVIVCQTSLSVPFSQKYVLTLCLLHFGNSCNTSTLFTIIIYFTVIVITDLLCYYCNCFMVPNKLCLYKMANSVYESVYSDCSTDWLFSHFSSSLQASLLPETQY